jgi:hypothetical protein
MYHGRSSVTFRPRQYKMTSRSPTRTQFKHDIRRFNGGGCEQANEYLRVEDFKAQLFIRMSPDWKSVSIHARATDLASWNLERLFEKICQHLCELRIPGAVADEQSKFAHDISDDSTAQLSSLTNFDGLRDLTLSCAAGPAWPKTKRRASCGRDRSRNQVANCSAAGPLSRLMSSGRGDLKLDVIPSHTHPHAARLAHRHTARSGAACS